MTARPDEVVASQTDEQVVAANGLFISEIEFGFSLDDIWRGVRIDSVRKLIDKHEAALQSANARLAAVLAEVDSLRGFAKAVMEDWWEGDLDGGSRQDIAERYGLIAGTERAEPCGELCSCAETADFPTTCYRMTPLLMGMPSSKELVRRAAAGEGDEQRV